MYEKFDWSASTSLSARRLAHLETQFPEAVAIINVHNHDDRYYTKTNADITFFNSEFMGAAGEVDADKLDGLEKSALAGSILPIGAVLPWTGTDATIPQNWAACNGQIVGAITTPDLRGRFIVISGNGYTIGNTGGLASVVHTASVNIGLHIITLSEMPSHTHPYAEYENNVYDGHYSNFTITAPTGAYNTPIRTSDSAGGGEGHGHPGSTIILNSVDNRPPYYSLFYIMKVA